MTKGDARAIKAAAIQAGVVLFLCMVPVFYAAGWSGLMRDPWFVVIVFGNLVLVGVVAGLIGGAVHLVIMWSIAKVRSTYSSRA